MPKAGVGQGKFAFEGGGKAGRATRGAKAGQAWEFEDGDACSDKARNAGAFRCEHRSHLSEVA